MPARRRAFKVTPKARQDLDAIWLYGLKTWSIAQADNYYRGLISCFPDLASNAVRGRTIDGVRVGYKVFAFRSHYIAYTETERLVTIIRILHRRMNIAAHL